MDGKTLVIIGLVAGLALWLGMLIGQQQTTPYIGPVGPGQVDTGDTGTVSQVPDSGGVVWT